MARVFGGTCAILWRLWRLGVWPDPLNILTFPLFSMLVRNFGVGISDFKEIIQGGYHYVDKSLFIKELLEDGSKVVLLPRPRRFGKTLNISMLKYFFEKTAQ
jgi:Predicted AAA-ATPase.